MKLISDWLWEDKEVTESTNDDALLCTRTKKEKKFIISAKKQTKGRGRRGRQWVSLEGNLFFSQALPEEMFCVGQLVCVSAISLWETITEKLPKEYKVSLKWPNDVLIDNCKVSGTLLERGENNYWIIGIGVNICVAPKTQRMLYPVTSLKACGINIDRLMFLQSYVEKFDKYYQQWKQSGFENIRKKYLKAIKGIGEKIQVQTPSQKIEGIFLGVGDNGELLLKTQKETKQIFAGDIFYIKKES